MGALDHVRVCDFGGQLAGAGATKLLAMFGAEVIRVEDPTTQGRWDMMRITGPYVDDRRGVDLGGGFNNHNVNKLGVTLDLRTEEGRGLLERLLVVSDVVSENFAAGVLERLGFGYDELRRIRPDVIYVSNCGFGHTGPYRSFKTWGPVVQAVSGLTFTSGLPDEEPAGWGFSYMDHGAAAFMAISVLAALHERELTGEGQWIDLASTTAGLTLQRTAVLDWTVNGRSTRRPGVPNGNRADYGEMAPHGIYAALGDDRWVALACRDDDDWARLCEVLARDGGESDARFATLAGRLEHEAELDDAVGRWVRTRDGADAARELLDAGVPASVVKSPRERIDEDPDIAAWNLFPTVRHPLMGDVRVEGVPVHLSETDWSADKGGPLLGEDNERVLGELLGIAAHELDRLRVGRSAVTALAGLRVIALVDERTVDTGRILAEFGADVVLVEPPRGSSLRHQPPFLDDVPGRERSLRWWAAASGTRSIVVDLETAEGLATLGELVASADVVLEGRGHALDAAGLGWDGLGRQHPALIWVSITPFGRESVRAGDPTTDLTLLAGGGPLWNCGYSDHSLPPIRGQGNQALNIGAMYACIGTLTAPAHRDRTGRGQLVDVNITAACNVTCEHVTYNWLLVQKVLTRQTGRHAATAPTAPVQVCCADGQYVCTGTLPRMPLQFAQLYAWLDELGLLERHPDAVFLELASQRIAPLEIADIGADPEAAAILTAARDAMVLIASELPAYDFYLASQEHGFPAGAVVSPDEAFEDPHFVARGFQVEIEHPELGGTYRAPGIPYLSTADAFAMPRRAPLVNEHRAALQDELALREEPGCA